MGVDFLNTQHYYTMNIKRNIIFSLEKRKKDGVTVIDNVPIRMRVIYSNNRVDFGTGYRIDVAKWDEQAQRVKNGCTNKLRQSASEINADLLMYYTDMQNIFKEFEVLDIVPTSEQIKSAFNNKHKKDSDDTSGIVVDIKFFNAFDEFIRECGTQNSWGHATHEKFAAVRNHLVGFDENLTFEILDDAKLMKYLNYLRDTGKMRNTTIEKQLSYLKWFLRWSVKKGYNKNTAFDDFKPKLKTTQKKVIFLTWDELIQLRDFEVPTELGHLERVRDVFLFQCYTGLRHSDVYNLKRSDVKETFLEVTTVKTTDNLIIELNDYSKSILDKYAGIPFEKDKALPVISNQKMNDYLKDVAKLAGIDESVRETYYKGTKRIDEVRPKHELLSTHAGRRTFICNSLSMGIPAQTVMKWTGHSDYKAMKPYIDVADKAKQEAMALWNKKEEESMDDLVEKMKTLSKEELVQLLSQIK